MKSHNRNKKQISAAKRIITFVLMLALCFASVMSVMAADIKITVIDGESELSVETPRLTAEEIMKRAESLGMAPLTGYDEAILDTDERTLTIYRGKTATLYDNGSIYTFMVSSYGISQDSIINTCAESCGIAPVDPKLDKISYSSKDCGVTINRGFYVTLFANDKTQKLLVHYGDTVSDLLSAQNMTYGTDDSLNHDISEKLTNGMFISYKALAKITIRADGETKEYTVPKDTIENVLSSLNISVGEDDEISIPLETKAESGMDIVIGRVTYEEVTEEETIDYITEEKETSSLYAGTTSVETWGEEGTRKIVKKQKLVDGVVVEEEILSDEVTKAPVNKVVLVGTKTSGVSASGAAGSFVDYNGNTVYYSGVYSGKCSAYTGGGTTAIGVPAAVGYVAVNPNLIPYGTRLYICSPDGSFVYGYAIAADTGGAFMGDGYVADCYYDTLSECYKFGIRYMNVYILS